MHDHGRGRFATSRGLARAALAALLFVAAGILWPACSAGVTTTPTGTAVGHLPRGVQPADLNLLVITLDTTRADRLGAYGWPQSATPALDRIAAEGVLFEQAVSPAPLTLPAHSSLFTGKYPPHHGVRDNGGFFLDERETTLAERLKARGVKTGGFVGAYVLDRTWGIGQGFDTYFDNFDLSKFDAPSLSEVERPANEVADRALAWLETAKSSRFFGWIHFYDAHSPYEPPEPYRTRFADRPYLGEIAFVDSQVARIRAFLEAERLLDRTVVVVLGDHGESLGDHGEGTHGFFVYESVLHVPLMIQDAVRHVARPPGRRRRAQRRRDADRSGSARDAARRQDRRTERRELDDGIRQGARTRRVRRGGLSAVPLRLERSAEPHIGPLQVHRGTAPGVVRSRPGPDRNPQPLRPAPGAGRPHGRGPQGHRFQPRRGHQASRQRRPRRARETRRARLRRHVCDDARGRPIAARGSEGQDRALQPRHDGARADSRRQGFRRRPEERSAKWSRRILRSSTRGS